MRRRLFALNIAFSLLACLTAGCQRETPHVLTDIPLSDAIKSQVAITDAVAGRICDDFNRLPSSAFLGGPIKLNDYVRTAQAGCIGKRPVVVIEYRLTKRIHVMDNPNQFRVILYLDDNHTELD